MPQPAYPREHLAAQLDRLASAPRATADLSHGLQLHWLGCTGVERCRRADPDGGRPPAWPTRPRWTKSLRLSFGLGLGFTQFAIDGNRIEFEQEGDPPGGHLPRRRRAGRHGRGLDHRQRAKSRLLRWTGPRGSTIYDGTGVESDLEIAPPGNGGLPLHVRDVRVDPESSSSSIFAPCRQGVPRPSGGPQPELGDGGIPIGGCGAFRRWNPRSTTS